MSSDSDLDTSSYPCSQIELVDLNPIHMIRIPLFVTLLYNVGIYEVYIVIILSNTGLFPVKFVFLVGIIHSFSLKIIKNLMALIS